MNITNPEIKLKVEAIDLAIADNFSKIEVLHEDNERLRKLKEIHLAEYASSKELSWEELLESPSSEYVYKKITEFTHPYNECGIYKEGQWPETNQSSFGFHYRKNEPNDKVIEFINIVQPHIKEIVFKCDEEDVTCKPLLYLYTKYSGENGSYYLVFDTKENMYRVLHRRNRHFCSTEFQDIPLSDILYYIKNNL